VAEDFFVDVADDVRVLAEILIPGGVAVGAFVGAPDLVPEAGETEILLPRETRFRITDRPAADPIIAQMEVITR
jgi:hypothetical protein